MPNPPSRYTTVAPWVVTDDSGARVVTPIAPDIWWVVTVLEQVTEDEIWRRLQRPEQAEVMRVAQQTLDAELSGGPGRSSKPIRPGLNPRS